MTGTTIGAYRVLRVLGQGGMGTVYLAEHALLGRQAAIKVLLPRYSRDQEIVHRFFHEARAVTSISDPGIVQIFDFGVHTDGSAYIVMELLEGEPLDARLRRQGRLPPIDAVRLVRQCAGSLAAVHARGILHRDLKPENLYAVRDSAVTGGERLKILDFGVAKLIGDEGSPSKTRTGALIGTPIYMSPEQCRGLRDIDFRADIYSLGCVLFALVTGRPPFLNQSSGELIVAHLWDPPPAVSELALVPQELDEVVRCCLAKAPQDRYASMQVLGHVLDQIARTALYRPVAHTMPHLLPPPPAASGSAEVSATTIGSAIGETGTSASATLPRAHRPHVIAASAVVVIALGIGAGMLRGHAAPEGSGGPQAQTAQAAQAAPTTLPVYVPEPAAAPPSDAGTDAPASTALPALSGPSDPPAARAAMPVDSGSHAPRGAGKRAHVHRSRPRSTPQGDLAVVGPASMDRED